MSLHDSTFLKHSLKFSQFCAFNYKIQGSNPLRCHQWGISLKWCQNTFEVPGKCKSLPTPIVNARGCPGPASLSSQPADCLPACDFLHLKLPAVYGNPLPPGYSGGREGGQMYTVPAQALTVALLLWAGKSQERASNGRCLELDK